MEGVRKSTIDIPTARRQLVQLIRRARAVERHAAASRDLAASIRRDAQRVRDLLTEFPDPDAEGATA